QGAGYTPEVARVYIGSFWNEPLKFETNKRLWRRRTCSATCMFGKDNKKKQLIRDLQQIYTNVAREHNISLGDLPNLARMQQALEHADFSKFQPLKERLINTVDAMLSDDIAKLMQQIPQESSTQTKEWGAIEGGAFNQAGDDNPFAFSDNLGLAAASSTRLDREPVPRGVRLRLLRHGAGGRQNHRRPGQGRDEPLQAALPAARKIWKLADIDQDGMLDIDEFALAKYLIRLRLDGHELPNQLPDHLMPPSKK
uniref:EF-hand domain-containing protein n=1 Tax=Macrostomum lignano TaxID=282301 RepID=A0A1I8FRA0_9PLAT